jgi:Sec-independent protein translocase protein TatA
MARSIGKGLLEFQRGMNDWGKEAQKSIFEDSEPTSKTSREDPIPTPKAEVQETSAPKFEPPSE